MKFQQIFKFYGSLFLFFLIISIFTDEILTYIAVHKTCAFYEMNNFVVWLWNTFGYAGGEIVRLTLLAVFIVFPIYLLLTSKKIWFNFLGLLASCSAFTAWFSVVISNYRLLYGYFLLQ